MLRMGESYNHTKVARQDPSHKTEIQCKIQDGFPFLDELGLTLHMATMWSAKPSKCCHAIVSASSFKKLPLTLLGLSPLLPHVFFSFCFFRSGLAQHRGKLWSARTSVSMKTMS